MMDSDSAWDDAFHDLWLHTVRHRGLLTSLAELPGPARDSAMPAWPRTRGADVLAIASVIDPVLRAQPRQPGSYGIGHQWRCCTGDIADHALANPEREYALNRAFWATLAEVAAYLASIDAAIPADLWRALFAEIAGPREHRNARILRDDHLQVMAASYEGLWLAQNDALARLRGADVCEPTGQMRGPSMAIPRTTLADVLHLADFWIDTMHLVERKGQSIPPDALATLGYNAARRHWYAALADLDHEFEVGEPEDVYTQNHELWRAAAHLATVLAVIDEAPSKLDQVLSGVITRSRDAGGSDAPGELRHRSVLHDDYLQLTAHNYDQMWQTQKATLAQLRGADTLGPVDEMTGPRMTIPHTTNADVLHLVAFWTDALITVERKLTGARAGLTTSAGLPGVKRRWQAAVTEVNTFAANSDPDLGYPQNHAFWRASSSLSITLSVLDEALRPPMRNAVALMESAYDEIWTAQRAEYEKQRGVDLRDPLPDKTGRPMKVPRTTNADVLKLAGYWADAWAKLAARWATGSIVNPLGLEAERARWQAAIKDVEQYAKPGNPEDVYPKNHEFWRETSSLSITLAVFKESPTPYELMFDSTVQAVKDLPGRIADAAGAVANAVGNIAHEVGAGFLKSMGPPLLIGGGVLLGAYLLFRNRPHETSAVP